MEVEDIRSFYMSEYAALKRRPRLSPSHGARNLVLGLATNLGKADIEVFVNSLRRCGYRDEIALFVTRLDPEMEAFCLMNGVTPVKSTPALHSNLSLMLLRFLFYYDFLMSRLATGQTYDRVLLTDVTDVVFQSNPFAIPSPERLTVFSEGGVTIGECPVNGGWMKYAFGNEVFDKLKGERVICAGTTLGPMREILDYLLKMMLGATNANPGMLSEHGIDQAIHNYLIYNEWLPGCVQSENGDIVLTIHYHVARKNPIFTNGKGRLCDESGHVFPVLHQYTRVPRFNEMYREEFADAC